MTSRAFALLFFVLCFNLNNFAQGDDPFMDLDFLIIASSTDLKSAVSTAKKAAEKTGLPYFDRQLKMLENGELTLPADTCDSNNLMYPCYFGRGLHDCGNCISVEYSSVYDGFREGYFIVVAATGSKQDETFKETFKRVKQQYPGSYVKQTKIYMDQKHGPVLYKKK